MQKDHVCYVCIGKLHLILWFPLAVRSSILEYFLLKFMQDSVDGIIASVGGIRKMLVKQEHMVDDISGIYCYYAIYSWK